MGLLKNLILSSIQKSRYEKRLKESRQYQEGRTNERRRYQLEVLKNQRQYEQDKYGKRRSQNLAEVQRQREQERKWKKEDVKERRKYSQDQQKLQDINAKHGRSTSRKMKMIQELRPKLAAQIQSEGGNLEDYVNAPDADSYLKGLNPDVSQGQWESYKSGKEYKPKGDPKTDAKAGDDLPEHLQKYKDFEVEVDPNVKATTDSGAPQPEQAPSGSDQMVQNVVGSNQEPTQPSTAPNATLPLSGDAPLSAPEPAQAPGGTAPPVNIQSSPSSQQAPQSTGGQMSQPGLTGTLLAGTPLQGIAKGVRGLLPQGAQQGDIAMGQGLALGVGKAGMGAVQAVEALLEKTGIMSKETYKKHTKAMSDTQKEMFTKIMLENPKANVAAVKASVIAGEVLPWLAATPAGAGGALARMGTLSGLGAAAGAGKFVEPDQQGFLGSRGFNTAVGGLVGLATTGATSLLRTLATKFTKRGAQLSLSRSLSDAKAVGQTGQSAIKAADRLGARINPASATQNPSVTNVAKNINSLGRTATGSGKTAVRDLTAYTLKNEKILRKQFTNQMDTLLKGRKVATLKKEANAILDKVMPKEVPSDVYTKLMKNPSIALNAAKVSKNANIMSQVKGVKSYSFFKNVLDKMRGEASALKQAGDTGSEGVALNKAAKQLSSALKQSNAQYKMGMGLQQRATIADKWQKELTSVAKQAGQDAPTLPQTYKAIFAKTEKFNEFLADLKAVGLPTQPAKDMQLILNRISNSPLTKLLNQKNLGNVVSGMSVDQGPIGASSRAFQTIFKRTYNNELIRIMTSGKWNDELASMAKIKSVPLMMDRLSKLLTVSSARVRGSEVGKPFASGSRN